MNAAETVAAACVGAVLGIAEYEIVNRLAPANRPAGGSSGTRATGPCLLPRFWCASWAAQRSLGSGRPCQRTQRQQQTRWLSGAARWRSRRQEGFLPLTAGMGILTGHRIAGATGMFPRAQPCPRYLRQQRSFWSAWGLRCRCPRCPGSWLDGRLAPRSRFPLALRCDGTKPSRAAHFGGDGVRPLVFAGFSHKECSSSWTRSPRATLRSSSTTSCLRRSTRLSNTLSKR